MYECQNWSFEEAFFFFLTKKKTTLLCSNFLVIKDDLFWNTTLSHCSLAVQLCNLQNTHHEMKQGVWGFEKWDNIMTKKQIS